MSSLLPVPIFVGAHYNGGMRIKALKVQVLGYGRQVAKLQLVQFESLCHARYSLDHGAPVRMNPELYHEISEEDSALPTAGRENGIIGSPEPNPNAPSRQIPDRNQESEKVRHCLWQKKNRAKHALR